MEIALNNKVSYYLQNTTNYLKYYYILPEKYKKARQTNRQTDRQIEMKRKVRR